MRQLSTFTLAMTLAQRWNVTLQRQDLAHVTVCIRTLSMPLKHVDWRRVVRPGSLLSPLLFGVLTLAPSLAAPAPAPDAPEAIEPTRPQVSSARGRSVVVTSHPLASRAAVDALRKGGSAMDALVSAQSVLAVVEAQSSGLGGGGFLLYWDQSMRRLISLDGRETAPGHATPEAWLDPGGHPVPWIAATSSLTAIGVPGIVALLAEGHQQLGSLPWSDLLQPAIGLA